VDEAQCLLPGGLKTKILFSLDFCNRLVAFGKATTDGGSNWKTAESHKYFGGSGGCNAAAAQAMKLFCMYASEGGN
jgi:hypothetical protein